MPGPQRDEELQRKVVQYRKKGLTFEEIRILLGKKNVNSVFRPWKHHIQDANNSIDKHIQDKVK